MLHRMEAPRVLVSENEFDFARSVRDFTEGDEANLLIYGGDGTIHRALNVLVPILTENAHARTKSIGFFRGGSGNGYHDSYRIPRTLKKQLSTFAESMYRGHSVPVDIMEIRHDSLVRYGQLFGTGFDADVLKRRNARLVNTGSRKKPKPGLLNYIRAALTSFCRLEIRHTPLAGDHRSEQEGSGTIRLEIGQEERNSVKILQSCALMIVIGKRPFYGNRFRVCPGAGPARGPMELILFDFKRKRSVVFHVLPLWMGWHGLINRIYGKKSEVPIKHYPADSCRIAAKNPFYFHVDGELITPKPRTTEEYAVRISILQGAVTFLVPKQYFLHHCTSSGISSSQNHATHSAIQ
jgi:diacylglycerol kinase family enzyme